MYIVKLCVGVFDNCKQKQCNKLSVIGHVTYLNIKSDYLSN